MELANACVGLVQLVLAILLAVVSLYIGYIVYSRITRGIDEETELSRRNPAVGIVIASIFFSIALVVQSGISGIAVGIVEALSGNWLTFIVSLLQLVLGITLAVGGIYLALYTLDRLMKGVDEFDEIRKGNPAVALVMAGVIVSTALIIQSGVIGITSALV